MGAITITRPLSPAGAVRVPGQLNVYRFKTAEEHKPQISSNFVPSVAVHRGSVQPLLKSSDKVLKYKTSVSVTLTTMFSHPVNVLVVNLSIFHRLHKQRDWGMKSSHRSSFPASQEDTQSIKVASRLG